MVKYILDRQGLSEAHAKSLRRKALRFFLATLRLCVSYACAMSR
jgi:hypothetical protein